MISLSGKVYVDVNANEFDDTVTATYTLTVTVSDGAETDSVDITVNIINVNKVPYYTNLPESVGVNEDVIAAADIFTAEATDNDGDSLTYSLFDVSPTTSVFAIDSSSKYNSTCQSFCIAHGLKPPTMHPPPTFHPNQLFFKPRYV